MLIDSTHRSWLAVTLLALGAATLAYVPYHVLSPAGPKGGSLMGLFFGIAGSVCMLYAGLLGARKKVPVWRVGRAQTWMRGHLWLGLLSLPLILFHAGFKFGGTLTQVLMWLLIIVVISGIVGAALQHYLPRMMTQQAPLETIYEQIGNIRGQLIAEAGQLLSAAGAAIPSSAASPDQAGRGLSHAEAAVAANVKTVETGRLTEFYTSEMRPFLEQPTRHHLLADGIRAQAAFRQVRTLVSPELHSVVADLENICEEARQLIRQEKLHHILHGWLLLHIPLSLALLVLGAVHAVMALRY